jgi:hypothetical protein
LTSQKSPHNTERDRIAESWPQLSTFTCAGCKTETPFPAVSSVNTEVQYNGRFRADVAAFDVTGRVVGVVEVVYSHPPTEKTLAAQEFLGFAYYRLLSPPWRSEPSVWLCSPEC